MSDIPDFDEIVVASDIFDDVTGFYPGMAPEGNGKANAPDGPFLKISALTFGVDHGEIPDFLLQAVNNEAEDTVDSLDAALIKELEALGYSADEIAALADKSPNEEPEKRAPFKGPDGPGGP